ncbi:MAG: class IV adenylate cyclase [Desulfovibrionaceae bacterium]
MALEKELKYLGADLDGLRERLEGLAEQGAAAHLAGPYLEANLVFDLPGRPLKAARTLLRLRRKGGGEAVLCVKRAVAHGEQGGDGDGGLKTYEEHETVVADFDAARALLEALGYAVALRYEKLREVWRVGGAKRGVKACLDELPFGPFVELEGEPEDVRAAAALLGLGGLQTSTATYHALNRSHQLENGLPRDESFCFPQRACGRG